MAKKLESTFINMVVVLFSITLVAAVSLAYVYKITKEPIAQTALDKKLNAIANVVDEFDNNPNDEMYKVMSYDNADSLEFYPAKKDGKLIGYAIKTFTMKGFSGLIELMVGFKSDNSINSIAVLWHAETPGLGTKMKDDKFKNQFKNKHPKDFNIKVRQDGGEIDAITAATISSRAFSDAVDRAFKTLEKGGKKWVKWKI